MIPQRIQRKRTKGWRMPENTVVVDRSSGFGNPFKVQKVNYGTTKVHPEPKCEWWVETSTSVWRFPTKDEAQTASVKLFRANAESAANSNWRERTKLALRGKNLACWCALNKPCHADVLIELANAPVTA